MTINKSEIEKINKESMNEMNEYLDMDKTPSFEEAYLEDSVLSEKVIEMYNIEVSSYEGIQLYIHKPNYISIMNPVITEDEVSYMISNDNGRVTIWKSSLIVHIDIF